MIRKIKAENVHLVGAIGSEILDLGLNVVVSTAPGEEVKYDVKPSDGQRKRDALCKSLDFDIEVPQHVILQV